MNTVQFLILASVLSLIISLCCTIETKRFTKRTYKRSRNRITWKSNVNSSAKKMIMTRSKSTTCEPTASGERIYPYNLHQFYATPDEDKDDMEVVFIRDPYGGKQPKYIPPNITKEERQRRNDFVKGRANRTDWCRCGNCPAQNNDEDSFCCLDDYYFSRFYDILGNTCYADTGFGYLHIRLIDLNDYRLNFLGKVNLEKKYNVDFTRTDQNELWRWLCYRKILRHMNSVTPWTEGRFNWTIPACVVDLVRGEYPEPDGKYKPTGWSMFGAIRMPH